jgi:hypothetical protein
VPLPFDPIAPVTIDVALGCANEVAVDVVPRAFVELRACDASGMEMSTALLTVWVDGRRARNRDAKTSQRWLGWLPPGIHRVVVDRNGASREHVLRGRPRARERNVTGPDVPRYRAPFSGPGRRRYSQTQPCVCSFVRL